eukprot:g2645.t1
MGEEGDRLALAAESDSEFGENYQDQFIPDAGGAPGDSAEVGNDDDDEEFIDDANKQRIEEEERAPTSADIWRKAQQDFVEELGTDAGKAAAPAASSSSSSGVSRQLGATFQRVAASTSAENTPPVAVSRSYTSLISNTKKQTFMLPEEFALIVDESDVDWCKNLVNAATVRLAEVEKELRTFEQRPDGPVSRDLVPARLGVQFAARGRVRE